MQDDNCVGECSWTRTVTNPTNRTVEYDLSVASDGGTVFKTKPGKKLKVKGGESKSITVYADTSLADGGWNYASLEMSTKGKKGKKSKKGSKNSSPDLHMPIAVQSTSSSDPTLLTKTVDAETAAKGEILMYEINVTNGPITGQIDLEDRLGKDLKIVPGSLSQSITNGMSISGPTESGGNIYSSFMLDPGGIQLVSAPGTSPGGGYLPMSIFFAPLPLTCNGDCDDGGYFFNVPTYIYNGQTYSQTLFSVNGTLEAGSASGAFSSFNNQNLPDAASPNDIIAPFWRDLNMNAGGNMYIGVLSGGGPWEWTIYEWEQIPHFGGADTVTMQVWMPSSTSPDAGTFYIAYGPMDNTADGGTVGVENSDGTIGSSYFYNGAGTAPMAGDELIFEILNGGTATINFEAEIKKCHAAKGSKKSKGSKSSAIINRTNITADGVSETAIAVTECVK
jgi:uncharacterized repeat protein (TIGR01451 family)